MHTIKRVNRNNTPTFDTQQHYIKSNILLKLDRKEHIAETKKKYNNICFVYYIILIIHNSDYSISTHCLNLNLDYRMHLFLVLM